VDNSWTRREFVYGLRILSASLLLATNLVPLWAEANDRTIGQFVHTSWTEKDGAPPVFCLAQTTDGFLWLGTQQGLYRFDGISFERYEPPSGPAFPAVNVRALLALPNGDLWIGFAPKGVSRLRGGRNTNYSDSDGLQPGRAASLAQDREGAIWAATAGGLARFKGDHWERIGADWGYPGGAASATYVDRHGTLWAAVERTLISLPPGARKFQPTGIAIGLTWQITESPDGTLWMAETTLSVHPVHSFKPEIKVGSMNILFDDDGSLWITSLGDGMRRVPFPDRLNGQSIGQFSSVIESFTTKDGLTSDLQNSILKDREGNIWVGTFKGLDRFRRGATVPIVLPPKFTLKTLVPGDEGALWVCGWSDVIARIEGNTLKSVEESAEISQGFRDAQGVVWFLRSFRKRDGPPYYDVSRLEKGRVISVAMTLNLPNNFGEGALFATDRNDTIWFGWFRAGSHKLFYQTTKVPWTPFELPPAIAGKTGVVAFTDSNGRIWFGFTDDTIMLMDDAKAQMFSTTDGIKLGTVKAITGRGRHIWIGGDNGLEIWENDRFRPVFPADGDTFHNVAGIQEDSAGDLFLSEKRGLVFIPANEISKTLKDPSARVQYRVFDERDGLAGAVVQGTDGRIWVSTSSGVAWIDPARIPKNTLPPPIVIRSITSNGIRYASPDGLSLPPRTRDLTIDYTALGLAIPERVQFRYKLEGSDTQWQEAGTRRRAFYTNLSHGKYRFRVTASNNDGVWNEAGASWGFSIAPTFYETLWFQTLMALAGIGLIWLLYRLRVRQITARADLRYTERLEERTRIARDLHDTLLQSFQGLMLHLEVVNQLLPEGKAKAELTKSLGRADSAIAEGRSAVYDLRPTAIDTSDLPESIKAVGDELSAESTATFRLVVEGPRREVHTMIRDELYRITREALRNAFLHAHARNIEAEITYGERTFRLRIRDDGEGIPPELLAEGRPGHYGMPGMRERAKQIGGKFDIWSGVGTGTEIDLSVAGSIAYRTSTGRSLFRLFRKKAG
jgi:signal transduction histidine kinase/ligand-binding sensor domain-containing protein